MNNKPNKTENRESGQSFMELALMFVTLMMIVAFLVDFGRVLYTYMSLVDSAQEGLLFLSLDPDGTNAADIRAQVEARVQDSTTFPSDMANVTVDIPMPTGGWLPSGATDLLDLCAADLVTVNIVYPFVFTMPFIDLIFDSNSIDLNASATGPIFTPICAN